MFGFRKIFEGLKIVPKTTSTAAEKGDMDVTSADGKLHYSNGTTASVVVTESHSATLTNKTIDADQNTISNIENADIKAGAAIDATKLADGSVTNTELQYINSVTSNVQTQLDGKVIAPVSTDNAITRFDGVLGQVQNSLVIVSDLGGISGATQLDVDNIRIDGNTISSTDTNGNINISPNGTGSVVLPTGLTGPLKAASGVVSASAVNLTSEVTGVLPVANGGTNSSTALNNNRVMVSSGGAVVEAAALSNGQILIGSTGAAPVAASLTAGTNITITPGAGTITIAASGGGGGGSASSIESLLQKAEYEKAGLYTEALDNSVYASGMKTFNTDAIVAKLLKDTASASTALELSFSPIFLNDSDKNTDSTTGFTAVGAGTTLTTSATATIGSASLSFDKDNSATEAGIRYDRGSQDLSLGTNYIAQCYINLPDVTDLSDVYIKVYADTTSNYRKYTKTADVDGTALAVGQNLIRVDLSNTSGSTTGGTGWDYTQRARYVEIGVDTGSAATTYTAILVDSIMFSLGSPEKLGLNGSEVTIYDTTNKQSVILDISNTNYDTRLTLKSGQSLSSSYTGGSSASAAGVERMTTSISGAAINMNTALSSGAVSTQQELRLQRLLRESLTMDIKVAVDSISPQYLVKVTAVGGSTIDIQEQIDYSANWANGDTVHVHRPRYNANGETHYDYIGDKTLSASSSHSGSTTTLTLTVAGIAVGDVISKKHITSYQSMVALGANESFTSLSLDASPNGVSIVDDYFNFPNAPYAVGGFSLGGGSANLNIRGPISSLGTTGSLNTNTSFLSGRLATTNFSGSNYYTISTADSSYFNSINGWEISIFGYFGAFDGNNRLIMSNFTSPNTGFGIFRRDSANEIGFYFGTNQTGYVQYIPNAWNHIYVRGKNGNAYFVVNGIKSSINTGSNTDVSQAILIGNAHSGIGSPLTTTDRLADLNVWSNGPGLSIEQVKEIYNGGSYRSFDQGGLRYTYTATSLTGQKLSTKHVIDTTSTAVLPTILKVGAIKS
jgi:hypothetical protein